MEEGGDRSNLFKKFETDSTESDGALTGLAKRERTTLFSSRLFGMAIFSCGLLVGFLLTKHLPKVVPQLGIDTITLDTDRDQLMDDNGMTNEITYGSDDESLGYGPDDEDALSMDSFADFVDVELPLKNINAGKQKPKLIFFAGNAYSGHDMLENAIQKACDGQAGNCVSLCEEVIDTEMFYGTNVDRYYPARERTIQNLDKLAKEAQGSGKIYFGNLYGNCVIPTTYPDLERSGKGYRSHFHPDVFLLAEIAEETGWDLELVVLLRDVEYVAERFIRDFHNYGIMGQGSGEKLDVGVIKFMENGFQNLFAQVSMLDNSFYNCYDVDDKESDLSITKPLETATGLHNLDAYMKEEQETFVDKKAEPLREGAQIFIRGLKLIRSSFNKMCERNNVAMTKMIMPSIDGGKREISEDSAPSIGFGMPHRLKKTVFSKLRLVFFVGLEGTGHHLWQGIVMKLLKNKQLNAECKLNDLIMHPAGGCWAPWNNGKGFFCSAASESFKTGYEMAADAMMKLKASNATGTHMLNLVYRGWKGNCGSIASYPCFGGSEKNLQHPDVLKLAELAESIGIDFRVVLLQRKAEELVISDIWHRHFNIGHPKMYEERVLENNAASIYTTIATMDPKFYSCTQYDDSTFSTADHVGSLMQVPTLKETLQGIMHVRKANATVHLPLKHEAYVQTLRAFNSATNHLCSKSLGHL